MPRAAPAGGSDSAGILQAIEVTATVNGPLTAKVTTPRSPLAVSSALLKGSAVAFISNGSVENNLDPTIDGILSLGVMGFKQSNADPGAGTLVPPSP